MPCFAFPAGRLKPATRRWLHVDYFGGVLPRDLWKPWAPAPTGSELQGRTYKRGKWAALKERIWMFLSSPESSIWAYACSLILLFIILIAVLGFILETIPQLNTPDSRPVFKYLEAVCIQVFALEYLLKLFSTDVPKLQFIREPLNVVDLVAIVPWYIEQILNNSSAGSSTAFLRVLRLFRVFRVLKLSGRYSKIGLVMRTLTNSVDMLLMMVFLTSLAIVMFSTLIFFCERGSMHPTLGYFVRNGEPNTQECILPAPVGGNGSSITTECPVPSPFTSIPESFWWCIVTLMTVGYGDVVPITVAGKLVASLCMVVGILTLALPISVIGTNFTQVRAGARPHRGCP